MQYKRGGKGMDYSLQVGDMGIGFSDGGANSKNGKSWSPEIDLNHKFIRGNHDDPSVCESHPNYLGDWGFLPNPNIFYMSGGFSIDREWRTRGLDFWEDEQLSDEEMQKALNDYKDNKPKIVASHECPVGVKNLFVTNPPKLEIDSRTEKILQDMFEIHQPDYWIFGHHHQFKEKDFNGTHFVCLDELLYGQLSKCIYEIPNLIW